MTELEILQRLRQIGELYGDSSQLPNAEALAKEEQELLAQLAALTGNKPAESK